MLSSRNINNSPTKQNQSPQGSITSSPKKSHINQQLIKIFKQNNVIIPSHLLDHNKKKKAPVKQFRLRDIRTEQDFQLKSLRIKLNDYQFQLKKVQEDFAQYKVVTKIQKQKTVKKLKDQIDSLKKQFQQSNANWEKRFSTRSEEHDAQKRRHCQKIKSQFQQKLKIITKDLHDKYSFEIEQKKKKNIQLKNKLSCIQATNTQQKKIISEKIEQLKNYQIQSLRIKHVQTQKVAEQKMVQKIQYVQNQKIAQKIQHEQTKRQLEKQKRQFQSQIYYISKQIDNLKIQINALQKKNIGLSLTIKTKQILIEQLKKNNEQQKNQIEKAYRLKSYHQISEIEQLMKQIKSKHIDELNSYYSRINNLEERKIESQNKLKQQIAALQDKFSLRPSKKEDLDQIARLKCLLNRKQSDIQRYFHQLKYSELQRQNNQKNYNKIFNTQSSRGRKSCSSTHRDKQHFFKKNTPTDIKFLLKICNKEF